MTAARAAAALTLLLASPVLAGPPYDTDDPQPTELHHWEIYNFVAGARAEGSLDGAAGVDLNYGGFREVQLTATLPLGFSRAAGERFRAGASDVELGIKARLYHDEKEGLAFSVFPRAILPTGSRAFGGRRIRLLLPVWAEKDSGPWSVFGGGGFELNPGAGNRDFWIAGVAVTREFGERLSVGAELFHQGPDSRDARPETRLGLGATAALGGPYSLLVSGGPSFSAGHVGAHGYAALGLSF
ncbi:hypothetical protein HMF7854_06045 [Sphingomonas ginkgonis]|uniref:Transporter n=1 Tax=Sphingomonas ginkgonis TaxID=2315330 RepID=A0A3R9YLS9_9SPHN|nr:hypothetical protein [Sphingomonas ginkgonis]RST30436.1 hypothetical protein HMF7854_06045 [Sphingomonas ginkgonis]